MAYLSKVFLIVQTADGEYDGTPDNLELELVFFDYQLELELETNQSNSADGDSTKLDVGIATQFNWSADNGDFADGIYIIGHLERIDLEIEGKNAWKPNSIWVILVDDDNESTLTAAIPDWENGCFSTDSSDCGGNAQQSYTIYEAS